MYKEGKPQKLYLLIGTYSVFHQKYHYRSSMGKSLFCLYSKDGKSCLFSFNSVVLYYLFKLPLKKKKKKRKKRKKKSATHRKQMSSSSFPV